jgi:hypothetical protein
MVPRKTAGAAQQQRGHWQACKPPPPSGYPGTRRRQPQQSPRGSASSPPAPSRKATRSAATPPPRAGSLWLLSSSPGIETGTEVAEHLHRLLAILEPATQALWELADAGYNANWFCYIASNAAEHAAELDRQTLQRILALPGDLWLDVCGEYADR